MHSECRKYEQGFSLIGAIFLLVVIGMLSSMAMAFAAAQQRGVSTELLRARADLAARAGLEWAAWQLRRNTSGTFALACRNGGILSQPPVLAGSLDNFSVNIAGCSATSHDEGGTTRWFYAVAVSAAVANRNPGQPGYAEAAIDAVIEGGV